MKEEDMDERTEAQKLADTAANSERHVIGGPMTEKVLVIAPTYDEARRWAHEHAVDGQRMVYVGPSNFPRALNGVARNTQHVILRWWGFMPVEKDMIKQMLAVSGSVPFEEIDDVDAPAVDVRF